MTEQTPRELLAEADQQRALADGADWAMTKIRLGEKPEVRKGRVGFWRRHKEDPSVRPLEFTAAATSALYLALAEVRGNATRKADELEARVGVTP
ncbi:hypothetical protein [Cellulomonas rhizosphaerae]|uniref:Uncharacterized protein n=1 Tax=Cellulomonas rhizosphaerae TaxID=2293719 RepID=A0A413RJG2_9CELL|nr:hypothetical protein [Cellulomonas rhizosphaerae]RHA38723.1 hypothetical protein D1825_13395 [Cellulomonas rhizosphaerae]